MKSYSPSYLQWRHADLPATRKSQLEQALLEHPEDHLALHYHLALFYLNENEKASSENMQAAARHIIEHGEDTEDLSTGYELLAICYEHLEMNETMAIDYYKASLEQDPTNESSLGRLGEIYMRRKAFGEALPCFQTLEECSSGDVPGRAWYYLPGAE